LPTILIAEDNDDLRAMLRQLLEGDGYAVAEAGDGRAAVEATVGQRPDLIIMDLAMPDMDGLSAVAEIRRQAGGAAETPVLIVSAFDRIEYRTEAVSAGCGGFIVKPVDPAALLRTVRLMLRQEVEGDAAATP